MPWPVLADTGELRVAAELFGHHVVLRAARSSPGRVGVGLVDLVDRDHQRHPAAFACWIASIVCGITPSSAATTSTTMSVSLAPRARIAVNAAWPGVSRKLITPFGVSTWYAPMCWVMPPASPAATLVRRM
jgi:hypothetical protein